VEEQLIGALEQRVTKKGKLGKFVGLVFATAGTVKANESLSRHPEVWATCLTDAGYLSDSFEELLFVWVQEGDDTQCFCATDALLGNLLGRNISRLIELLPALSANKADHVAKRILTAMLGGDRRFRAPQRRFNSHLAVICVLYVKRPEQFLRRHLTEDMRGAHHQHVSRREFNNTSLLPFIATLFFLAKRYGSKNKDALSDTVQRTLSLSQEWINRFPLMLCLAASAFALFALSSDASITRLSFTSIAFLLLLLGMSRSIPTQPWVRFPSRRRTVAVLSVFLFAVCCSACTVLVLPIARNHAIASAFTVNTPLFMCLLGIAMWPVYEFRMSMEMSRPFFHSPDYPSLTSPLGLLRYAIREGHYYVHSIAGIVLISRRYILDVYAFLVLLILSAVSPMLTDSVRCLQLWLVTALIILIGVVTAAIFMLYARLRLARAFDQAEHFLQKEVRNLETNKLLDRTQ
jgi:hypothetical protein